MAQLHGQPSAPFKAASLEHLATARSGHADAKTMCLQSLADFRLPGSFGGHFFSAPVSNQFKQSIRRSPVNTETGLSVRCFCSNGAFAQINHNFLIMRERVKRAHPKTKCLSKRLRSLAFASKWHYTRRLLALSNPLESFGVSIPRILCKKRTT